MIKEKRLKLMKTIAIFASGEGTNAENLIKYFADSTTVKVALVVYNRKEAGVRLRAEKYGIPTAYIPKASLSTSRMCSPFLKNTELMQ